MTRLFTAFASVGLGLALTSGAYAQRGRQPSQRIPQRTAPTAPTARTPRSVTPAYPAFDNGDPGEEDFGYEPLSGIGIAIAAGGGAGGFTSQNLRDIAAAGTDWDVRVTVGTRAPIAFEGSYIGSVQSLDALGLARDARLVGNGVQGALRLNMTRSAAIQPFLFGGAAWRNYKVRNTALNHSDVSDNDDVLELPIGVGIAARYMGMILDARGEFSTTTNGNLLPAMRSPDGDNATSMNRWGARATIGFEF